MNTCGLLCDIFSSVKDGYHITFNLSFLKAENVSLSIGNLVSNSSTPLFQLIPILLKVYSDMDIILQIGCEYFIHTYIDTYINTYSFWYFFIG